MTNHEIARIFDKTAFFLSLQDESDAKIAVYARAAKNINDYPAAIEDMLLAGEDLMKIEGVGKILAQQLEDLVIIGSLHILEDMLKKFPGSLYELAQIKGIGPKTILKIFSHHQIKSLAELKLFLRSGESLAIAAPAMSKIQEFFER
ncbi:MAG: helix-hairpin-helix domain-containing protein [Candidatus Aminicenantes bacterium]|nr:helix-hairpin-helix domain-containing protein [Candidatus Aminicenantes bacterium]